MSRVETLAEGRVLLHCGDCLDVLKTLEPNSVDACVTDPPYGLSFMGKAWDHGVPGIDYWREVFLALKPGGHLLSFGGTRTYHRMASAIEDAGFEIRDSIQWLYGSGFPKSLDVSKAIDKMHGAERDHVATGIPVKRMIPGAAKADSDDRLGSKHPTIKPVDLMQYLVRLVTPPKGLVLDPFAGTGTTGEACIREGMRAILIEREAEYQDDIRRRMKLAMSGPDERAREAIKAKLKDKPLDHGPLFGGSEMTRGGADRFTDTSPIRTNDWADGT